MERKCEREWISGKGERWKGKERKVDRKGKRRYKGGIKKRRG